MTDLTQHQKNLRLQANEHPLVEDHKFMSMEEYVQHLIHRNAYETAGEFCRGKDVLDWGCNVGYGLEILAKTAASVSGLDLSEQAIEMARRRLGSRAAHIECYHGDRCSFSDNAFDVVTSFQVLEHVSDYEIYFGEISRVLRPGGLLILTTPNAAIRLEPGMKPWNEFHVHEFTPAELREFLAARFEDVAIRGLFASDKFYEIERNRAEQARRNALMAQKAHEFMRPLKTYLKERCPWLLRIRNSLAGKKITLPSSQKALEPAELACFSPADLFYREDQLDQALDLMALCRNPRKPGATG